MRAYLPAILVLLAIFSAACVAYVAYSVLQEIDKEGESESPPDGDDSNDL